MDWTYPDADANQVEDLGYFPCDEMPVKYNSTNRELPDVLTPEYIREVIDKHIHRNKVVIYLTGDNDECNATVHMFNWLLLWAYTVQLDTFSQYYGDVEAVIQKMTGRTDPPYVFIGGKYFGSRTEL